MAHKYDNASQQRILRALLMLARNEFNGVAPGARMAVTVITREPIAYQVKGAYAGTRAGAALIELDACYSASPPLPGQRLDSAV